ncbi:MAG: CoA-binding protein [Betaproteobacteria bacterium]|nr:MAG: CoA-binding protein [Betaproteobacteria bacterium]
MRTPTQMPTQLRLVPGQRIAVVGLSAKPDRPSYDVSRAMQRFGFEIVPVNPNFAGDDILGVRCVASVMDIVGAVDIVDCFRKSMDMPSVAREVVRMSPLPQVLWMQLGVASAEAREIAQATGIAVVEDQCIKIAYMNQQ